MLHLGYNSLTFPDDLYFSKIKRPLLMFANWPVLINRTIILQFVNDADHMFMCSLQVKIILHFHETNIPMHWYCSVVLLI